jgi:hypothetical protein
MNHYKNKIDEIVMMIQHCHFVVMLEKAEHVPMSQVSSDVTEIISWNLSFLFSLYNINYGELIYFVLAKQRDL